MLTGPIASAPPTAAGARTFEDRDDGHAVAHILQPLEDKPPVGASRCHAPGLTQALEEERLRNLRRLTAHVAPVLERPRGGRRARELVNKLAHLCEGAYNKRAHVAAVRELDLSRTRGGAGVLYYNYIWPWGELPGR